MAEARCPDALVAHSPESERRSLLRDDHPAEVWMQGQRIEEQGVVLAVCAWMNQNAVGKMQAAQ
jgi:hypothetical protein